MTPAHTRAAWRGLPGTRVAVALASIALAAVVALPAPAPVAAAAPSSKAMAPACSGVNLRTSPTTASRAKVRLATGAALTVSATVKGASWRTVCAGSKAGSGWYRISAVNGKSVRSLYGVAYLYAATGVLKAASPAKPTTKPTAAPSTKTMVPACSGVNVRTAATTTSRAKLRLSTTVNLTVSATVKGASWRTACAGWKVGSSWYRISAINGKSVRSLYGVSYLYAATGVLKAAPAQKPAAKPAATPTPAPKATGPTAIGATVTLYGRGWGHGVGLSQYGARGRALAGQTTAQILAHYYRGTTIGSIPLDIPVRVILLDNHRPSSASPLTIYGRGGSWKIDGVAATVPADARLRLIPTTSGTTTTWRLLVTASDGSVLHDGAARGDFRVRPAAAGTVLQLPARSGTYDRFRGTLRVIVSGATVDVVNEVAMEDYLRGVVPAEMPSTWPVAARTAQTIAARSYAAYHLRPGVSTYDVRDDTRSQVYLGVRRETTAADAVVATTAGQVLRSGKAIVNAMFHSTGGGATEHNENAFVASSGARLAGPVSYLRGSADRDRTGAAYDATAPYATWMTKTYTRAALSAIFAADARTNVGALISLDLRNRGVSGRLVSVTLKGAAGSKTVSGGVFLSVFNANRPSGDPTAWSTLLDLAPIP